MVVLEKEFKPFLVEMRGIMTRLEHNLDPFLMSTQQFMKMMEIQFLPQTYRTLSNLEEMSHVFLGLTDEIKQDPSILIRGMTPPTPGPGESYAFED